MTTVEYVVLLVLIAGVGIASWRIFGEKVRKSAELAGQQLDPLDTLSSSGGPAGAVGPGGASGPATGGPVGQVTVRLTAIMSMRNVLRMLGGLGLLSLLAASGPCSSQAPPLPASGPATAQPPPAPPVPAAQPTPTPQGPQLVSTDPYTQATQLVDSISALTELNKAALDSLLGVATAHVTTALAEEQSYEAALPTGPFSRVEVRTSNPAQTKFALVILDMRAGTQLPLSAFRSAGRIKPDMPMATNPRVPPAGTLTFIDQARGQTVRYAFRADTQQLHGVVVERRPAP